MTLECDGLMRSDFRAVSTLNGTSLDEALRIRHQSPKNRELSAKDLFTSTEIFSPILLK